MELHKKKFQLQDLSKYRIQLMGICTIAILLCHASGRGVVMPVWLSKILAYGGLGVDIFLFLSGIGMYYSIRRDAKQEKWLGKWYARRFTRIGIPYVLISIPIWIVYCIVENKGIVSFFYYFLTIAYWTEHYGAWYFALLIPLYLMTPILSWIIEKSRNRAVICSLIIVLFVILGNVKFTSSNTSLNDIINNLQFVLQRLPVFVLGYYIGKYVEEKKSVPWIFLVLILPAQLLLSKIPLLQNIYRGGLTALFFLSIFTVIIKVLNSELINRILAFFGNISFESYLANVYLGYLFALFKWRIGKIDLSYGNYLYYSMVLIIGTIFAILVHKFTQRTTANLFKNK